MRAIGDVDEANCALGLAIAALQRSGSDAPLISGLISGLRRIQNDLFDLGADIATPGEDFAPSEMALRIVSSQVDWIEAAIDAANEHLSPLTSFILPGGSDAAAAMHLARAVTRRAEREMVAAAAVENLNPLALAYINRLSDYLFVLCRLVNVGQGGDILWVPGASR